MVLYGHAGRLPAPFGGFRPGQAARKSKKAAVYRAEMERSFEEWTAQQQANTRARQAKLQAEKDRMDELNEKKRHDLVLRDESVAEKAERLRLEQEQKLKQRAQKMQVPDDTRRH